MIMMIMSGSKIYNDDIIFSWLRFPTRSPSVDRRSTDCSGNFRMWIVVLNGLAYLILESSPDGSDASSFPFSGKTLLRPYAMP